MTEKTGEQNNDTQNGSRGSYASVNGLSMYYEIHGSGFPLVLLHGAFTTIEMFAALLPELSSNRQIIAVELQGHGRTADIEREIRLEYLADDVAALLAHLGIAQTDVFGYSMGGSVALYLARRHPGLVRKLALASTAYNLDAYYPEMREGLIHATPEGFPPVMREAYERVAPNPAGWPVLVAKMSRQAASAGGLQPEEVQSINVPTLVIAADGDIIRPECTQELARLLHAELVVLPDSDHASYIVAPPELLLARLSAFFDAPL
uniref:Oxidoreductase n=1 Tax=Thermosporothrix sp. COM3 TaxID=2490863 RepID=A0A455SHB6_9CHLR|nr:oxidoreductase [Thermosporothrix sp. COM3]